jgi:dTDP-4-dehydrorhamnose reductase
VTRLLVTGASGQLGTELLLAAAAAGHDTTGVTHRGDRALELTDAAAVRDAVERAEPEVIVHAAAWTAVDACEDDPVRAMAVNGDGTANVVAGARAVGARVLYVSTDYVFDGSKVGPYVEDDTPAPQSAYGRSKLAGERALGDDDTIVRTSWVCGAHGPNMVATILRVAANQPELRFVDDQVGNPTFTADLAPAILDLVTAGATGVFHLTNAGTTSWYGFARAVLAASGQDPDRVRPITTAELDPPRPAPRPANSALADTRRAALGLGPLPRFEDSLAALVERLGGR